MQQIDQLKTEPKATVLVGVKVPLETARRLKQAVTEMDTDISKFLRAAIREKLSRTRTEA